MQVRSVYTSLLIPHTTDSPLRYGVLYILYDVRSAIFSLFDMLYILDNIKTAFNPPLFSIILYYIVISLFQSR